MASVITALTSGGGLSMAGDTSGVLELKTNNGTTAVTIGTGQNTTFAQAINAPNTFGFKNRIINGAMQIDQRFAGASVINPGGYIIDRWIAYNSTPATAAVTVQRSTVAPAGFTNSFLWTTTTGGAPAAGDQNVIDQAIEGLNVADLGWGTANAKTVTLSFWVRSSLTGTFSGSFVNGAFNRSYPYTYTISSANTWEYKTVTVAGDTTGTWLTTNGIGLAVYFNLGSGSTYLGAAGVWASGGLQGATGSVNVTGTTGATFYITGVQLEVGTQATSFDYRPYGTEFQLCQRYYEVINIPAEALLGYYTTGNGAGFKFQGYNFAVAKRTAPTMPNATASGQWVVSGIVAVSANTNHTFTCQASANSFGGFCVRQAGGSTPNQANTYNWENTVTFTAPAEL